MTTLYFIRHGETDYNRKGIVQGGGVDSELNPLGHQQAKAFFHSYQDLSFDALYASQLQRTHQTLAPWQALNHRYITEAGLNEFNWGAHEGKVPSPADKQEFRDTLARWKAGDLHSTVSGGETPWDAWGRAEAFFSELPRKHSNQSLLLCSHGRQLRIILCNLLGLSMQEMDRFRHYNTGLTVVQYERLGEGKLKQLNDIGHLASLEVLD